MNPASLNAAVNPASVQPTREKGRPRINPVPTSTPPHDDGWMEDIRTKPLLLQFKGKEEVKHTVEMFFDDELIDNLVTFTNIKADNLSMARPQKRSPLKNFKPVTSEELRQFLGLVILMGNVNMPTWKHYWKKKIISITFL